MAEDEYGDSKKDAQRCQVEQRCKHEECRGVEYDGHVFATGSNARQLLTAAYFKAEQAKAASVPLSQDWQTKDGDAFVTLDADGIIGLGDAMFAFMQAVHLRKAALLAAIEADTYADTDLGTGWTV